MSSYEVGIVLDENGHRIVTDEGVLCQVLCDGNDNLLYVPEDALIGMVPTNEDSSHSCSVSEETNIQGPQEDIAVAGCSQQQLGTKSESEWGNAESKLLLDKYDGYMDKIGPLKTFKNKKVMWMKIATDLLEILGVIRTWQQCENRYKTILKRKVKATVNNRTSGATRVNVDFNDELEKIKMKDDSLVPEVMRGVGKVEYKRPHSFPTSEPKKLVRRVETLSETHTKLFEEMEKNKERRQGKT